MGIKFWIWFLAIGFSRNNWIHSSVSGILPNIFRVVAFVRDKVFGRFDFTNNFGGCFSVVNFTPSDFKIDRVSMRITGHVNFCCGSSSRFSDSSLFTNPSSACMLMSADVASIGEYPLRINFSS